MITRILSIDGGGILGIIPAIIIAELEKRISNITKEDAFISDYFDFFIGTSTGAILSAMYLLPESDLYSVYPKYKAKDVLDNYLKFGSQAFKQSFFSKHFPLTHSLFNPKYSVDGLEKALKTIFENVKLSQLLKPFVATAYETDKRETFFFSRNDTRKCDSSHRDFYIKDVLRATSAAPTYFKPAKIKNIDMDESYSFIDGGVFANNPALCGYCEVRAKEKLKAEDMFLVSLGTGCNMKSYKYDYIYKWGLAGWARAIINILMDGNSQTVEYLLNLIFNNKTNNYYRIDPYFLDDINMEMDDADSGSINKLVSFGNKVIDRENKKLDDIVYRLIKYK